MSDIHFRLAAKTDVGLERTNNEDNFQVSANLDEMPMKWVNNQEYSLGNKGALMVVADGMGGMNAGEVASEIAINTVRELFAPECITDEVVKSRFTIEKFMKGVIVEADKRIKDFARQNPDSQGMGTTIVIAWLFDGNLYVSWCGDSRAYVYNPGTGLFQISKDHSYVQVLVDKGSITREEAFDFPDSNIVTRSLTDSDTKAVPDSLLMPQPLCDGDIIMLCSDGLNGMLRDQEIEAIMAGHQDNMTACVDALIQGALDAAGADNCTVALCQILSGGAVSSPNRVPKYSFNVKDGETSEQAKPSRHHTVLWTIACLVVLLMAMLCGGWWWITHHEAARSMTNVQQQDSIKAENARKDSIDKARSDSMEQAKELAVMQAQKDSVEKARKDSLAIKQRLSTFQEKVVKSKGTQVTDTTIENELGMTEVKDNAADTKSNKNPKPGKNPKK